ncbi:MAG: helix-turn-helix domain-containing protein [Bacteroidales bacterium]|nr:helix-turn-helix domain-containing protein [Bacteroidales bacterium]
MSSKIEVQRICQHCGNEFTARTTVTQYCSDTCAKRAYKARVRSGKVETRNKETRKIKNQPIEELKAKEFLTVRDVATLLNSSLRTVYRLIEKGNIKAVNIAQRKTLVKRSNIDTLFEQHQIIEPQPKQMQFDISDCYTTEHVRDKYGISESGLRGLIIKHNIPKIKKGWFAYVPKTAIDKLLS